MGIAIATVSATTSARRLLSTLFGIDEAPPA